MDDSIFALLPPELIIDVFLQLPVSSLPSVARVCKFFGACIDDNVLWKKLSEKRWSFTHPVEERAKAWKDFYKERISPLYLFINPKYGQPFTVRLTRYDEVRDLKAIIEAQTGLPVDQQRLELNMLGKPLRDGAVIGDYVQQEGAHIILHMRPALNGPPAPVPFLPPIVPLFVPHQPAAPPRTNRSVPIQYASAQEATDPHRLIKLYSSNNNNSLKTRPQEQRDVLPTTSQLVIEGSV